MGQSWHTRAVFKVQFAKYWHFTLAGCSLIMLIKFDEPNGAKMAHKLSGHSRSYKQQSYFSLKLICLSGWQYRNIGFKQLQFHETFTFDLYFTGLDPQCVSISGIIHQHGLSTFFLRCLKTSIYFVKKILCLIQCLNIKFASHCVVNEIMKIFDGRINV